MLKRFLIAIPLALVLLLTDAVMPAREFTIEGIGNLSLETAITVSIGQEVAYATGSEIIEKRTRSSKTHQLDCPTCFSWNGAIGSIHYWEDEQWKEIDSYFEEAQAPWDWQMLKAGYYIRAKEDFTAGQIIEFEKQGETVQFQPMALEWTNDLEQIQPISIPQNVNPTVTNPEVDLLPAVGMPSHQGTIRWDNAYSEGIDFEWRCTSTRLVKILEVESFGKLLAPEQWIIDGGNPVLRLNLIFDPSKDVDIYVDSELWDKKAKKQTFNITEFKKDGEVLWGFMPLRYWDSGEGEGQSIATLEKRGNSLYISIRVPYDWLQSAVYPVFIDTDVEEYVGASLDDATEYGSGSFYAATDYARIYSNTDDTSSNYRCAGFRFTTVDIAQGSTIGTAYWEGYVYNTGYDSANFKFYANDVDDAKNFDAAPTGDPHVIGRARTTASASWVADNVLIGWKGSSIEIKTVIQEIISRDGWSANNALMILGIGNKDANKSLRVREWDYNDHSLASHLHIEYTAGAVCSENITNAPNSKAFGVVSANTSYWSSNSTPTFPLDDGECYFSVTNSSGGTIDITIKSDNFTGGVGWTLGVPAENVARIKAGASGTDNETAMVTLTGSYQAFIGSLADSASKKWEIKLETPTSFTDGVEKSATITLSATCQ